MKIDIFIPSDIFYSQDDTISIVTLPWTSNNRGVSEYISYDPLQSKVITKLAHNFIGSWEITLVGYDSILQGARASTFINGKISIIIFVNAFILIQINQNYMKLYLVIECNLQNWEIWDNLNYNWCEKWDKGYTLDSISKMWRINDAEIEVYLLICFIFFWIPIKILTNYRINKLKIPIYRYFIEILKDYYKLIQAIKISNYIYILFCMF